MEDRPVSDREIDKLYALARKTGIYREALLKQGLPETLADQLARDWHMLQLGLISPSYGATDRLVRDLMRAALSARGAG